MTMMQKNKDQDLAFACALAAAGLDDLAPGDIAFLREAFGRMQQPLQLPSGFVATTAPAVFPDIFDEATP